MPVGVRWGSLVKNKKITFTSRASPELLLKLFLTLHVKPRAGQRRFRLTVIFVIVGIVWRGPAQSGCGWGSLLLERGWKRGWGGWGWRFTWNASHSKGLNLSHRTKNIVSSIGSLHWNR